MTDFLPIVIEAPPEPEPPTIVMSEDEEDEPTGFREEVDTSNIFTTPVVQPITEGEPDEHLTHRDDEVEPEPDPEPEKPKRNKKQASKKQLEALAKSREKLKAKRLQARREKEAIQQEAKRLVKEKKAKEKEVKFEDERPPLARQSSVATPDIDIEGAISKALEKYDNARKLRKAEKKKRQQEEADKQKIQSTIQNAVNGGYKPQVDPWGDCFNFR